MEWVEERLLAESDYVEGRGALTELLSDALRDRQSVRVLASYLSKRELSAGETFFREGDDSDDIFIVIRGRLSAMLDLGGRGRTRLRKFSPGSIIGEMAYYGGGPRSATLVAESNATVFVMKGADLDMLQLESPKAAAVFHRVIATLMAQRLRAMNKIVRHLLA